MNTLKTVSALTLVMLLSLTGCKQKKQTIKETPSNQTNTVSIPMAQNKIHSFYDDDIQEFMLVDEADDMQAACNSDDLMKDFLQEEEYNDEFAWTIEEAIDPIADELKVVYFSFDGAGIQSDEKEKVSHNARAVKKVLDENAKTGKKSTVVIEGHSCHAAGSRVYNQFLSEKRANNITDVLVSEGITCSNMKTVGRGCEIPAVIDGKEVTGNREEQWLNRRCEISVINA